MKKILKLAASALCGVVVVVLAWFFGMHYFAVHNLINEENVNGMVGGIVLGEALFFLAGSTLAYRLMP